MLANERSRAESLPALTDALRYPAFLLLALPAFCCSFSCSSCQFGGVFTISGPDWSDPASFLHLSEFLAQYKELLALLLLVLLLSGFALARQPGVRTMLQTALSHAPLIRSALTYHRTALFCRNLAVLVGAGVPLTAALRILADMMASIGRAAIWTSIVGRWRQVSGFG
jgi:general secretion pathway protein F